MHRVVSDPATWHNHLFNTAVLVLTNDKSWRVQSVNDVFCPVSRSIVNGSTIDGSINSCGVYLNTQYIEPHVDENVYDDEWIDVLNRVWVEHTNKD